MTNDQTNPKSQIPNLKFVADPHGGGPMKQALLLCLLAALAGCHHGGNNGDDCNNGTGSWGGQIWDLATEQRRYHLESHTGFVTCAAMFPDGRTMATGSLDGTAKLYDVESGRDLFIDPATARKEYLKKLNAHLASVRSACQKLGIGYRHFATDRPLELALFDFLRERMQRGKRTVKGGRYA